MSRSRYMLAALAPPAESVPPTSVATTSRSEGQPPAATTIVGTVVTSSSSIMRGLVRATKAPKRAKNAGAARARRTAEMAPALVTTCKTLGPRCCGRQSRAVDASSLWS